MFTLHPSPFTLHPSPFTLHPSPFTLRPSPFALTADDPQRLGPPREDISLLSTQELQNQLGCQIERVISESVNPAATMEEIAIEAERRGLVDSKNLPRMDDPTVFVRDLWLDNPLILDRLNIYREFVSDSKTLEDLVDVLDILY